MYKNKTNLKAGSNLLNYHPVVQIIRVIITEIMSRLTIRR